MRKRLVALGLGVLGLGVPLLVAWLARREARTELDPPVLPDVTPPAGLRPSAPTPAASRGNGRERRRPALDEHVLEPHPTGIFAAIGRFDYRFRRVIPIVGLAIVIGLNVWARQEGGKLIQGGWTIQGSEEQQASKLLAERFGQQATTMLVVYRASNGDAASAAFQEQVTQSLADVASDPVVSKVTTYGETKAPELLSRDGSETLAVVTLDKEVESSVEDAARLADKVHPPQDATTYITGIPQLYHEFNGRIERDLFQAEAVSLPIALVILLVVFGSLVGAALPLLIAGFALPSTVAVIDLLAGVTDMSIFVTNIATMIGLALAIDYSLFLVSRFREELLHHSVEIAIERTMGSVGKAVAVSGVAVAIGLSSLAVFEAPALRSMGWAGIVTVISTLVFGLTVLPALLGMLGPRVNRLRVPLPRFLRRIEDDPNVAETRRGHGVWGWIAARVMRHPILIVTPVLAVLIALGLPFLSIQLSTGQNLQDLPKTPARSGFELVVNAFPGGESDPILVAVTWPGANLGDGISADRQSSLATYTDELAKLNGVKEVQSALTPPPGMDATQYRQLLALPPGQWPAEAAPGLRAYLADKVAGDTAKVTVFSAQLPDSDEGRALVDAVRGVAPPSGAQVLTGGLSSRSADFMESFRHAVPVAMLIVVAVTGGVLFLTFGSVFLPIKAVLMSLLSITASFGALVWIFQEGHLSEVLNFESGGTTAAWLPIIMFAILFGLSMDYEALLLSRIRERYLATGDNTRAVAEGIGITGGIITGAALIMVAVFAAFALSTITFIKALGFSMALAVLIDATIVRGVVVPAFMRVMGRINWWAPRWVQRIVARLGLYEGPDELEGSGTAAPAPAPASVP
jgi:RND superfamily putative drug exporter